MSREEIQKLLGGYATDTLTEAERQALFEAALDDQELFDALAKEQALREVLRDPAARREVIEALGPERQPLWARAWRWMRQPAALAMAGGLAGMLIVAGIVLRPKLMPRREAILADALVRKQELPTLEPAPEAPFAPGPKIARKVVRGPALQLGAPLPAAAPVPLPPPPAIDAAKELAATNAPRAPAAAPASANETRQETDARAQFKQEAQERALSVTGRDTAFQVTTMKRAKGIVAATPVVAYTLLRRGDSGQYVPVPAGTVFHAGDSVRLQVTATQTGDIYLFRLDAATGRRLVVKQPVEKAQTYVLPTVGGLESNLPAQVNYLLLLTTAAQGVIDARPAGAAEAFSKAKDTERPAAATITIEYR